VKSVSCLLHFAEAASTPTAISEPENKRSYRYGSGQPAGTLHAERSNKAHHQYDDAPTRAGLVITTTGEGHHSVRALEKVRELLR
jgi:hypothetical protein